MSGLFIAAIAFTVPSRSWPAEPPVSAPVQHARDFLKRVKALKNFSDPEERAKGGPQPDDAINELHDVDAALREYLTQNPNDTGAAVASMEIYGIRELTERSRVGDDVPIYATIADRALRADSTNAALHFWRGRLYAASGERDSIGATTNAPLSDALREARRAVALDPTERRYRESLGSILLATGDEAGARTTYRELGTDHPIYLLLHDWERMPAIRGMERTQTPEALALGALARSYFFKGHSTEFVSQARTHWPGFRLAGGDTTHTGYEHRGRCHLVWKGDVLAVDPHGKAQPELGTGGFWIDVLEVNATEKILPQVGHGIKAGETFCIVTCLDLRGFR